MSLIPARMGVGKGNKEEELTVLEADCWSHLFPWPMEITTTRGGGRGEEVYGSDAKHH